MRIKSNLCLFILAVTFFLTVSIQYSCTDPIEDQLEEKEKQEEEKQDSVTEQHDITKSIASFLQYSHEGLFSDFTEIVKRSGLWDSLGGSGIYTCFAPTNEALKMYLQEQYELADEHEKAMYQSIRTLSDSICAVIAKRHLFRDVILLDNLRDGFLPVPNLLNETINYMIQQDSRYTADGEILLVSRYIISPNSVVIECDDTVGNGMIQVIDRVLDAPRNQELRFFIPGLLKSNNETAPDYLTATIFYHALLVTNLRDSLEQYIDPNYPEIPENQTLPYYLETGSSSIIYRTALESETGVIPSARYYKYTLFVVTDSILQREYGINNIDELRMYAQQVYPESSSYPDDSPESSLYKLISYHILPCWLPYEQLNTTQPEIIQYRTMRDQMDVEDFYETMQPYAIMRISTPLDSKVERQGIYINRKGTVSSNNLTNNGTRIWEPAEYPEINSNTINGGYHYIDRLLLFDQETKRALTTRIRVMANTLSPDFINSGARGRLYESGRSRYEGNVVFGFKKGFCKNVEWSDDTYFYVRYRNQYFGCLYGDEMTIVGNYDITFRLPPVPVDATYEIRLWNYVDFTRGTAQYYLRKGNEEFIECGDPIDLTLNANAPSIGYISDGNIRNENEGLKEKEIEGKILENDRLMRSNGYMKAPDIYAPSGNSLRDRDGCYRVIVYKGHMQAGQDYYLRMRQKGEGYQYAFNFLEIVPKDIFEGFENEDRH